MGVSRLRIVIVLEVVAIVTGIILLGAPSRLALPTLQAVERFLPRRPVPKFDHIVVLMMENKSAEDIINRPEAAYFNRMLKQSVVAYNYSAVANPSLPNYLALIGGATFGVRTDCTDCFKSAPNLIDQIEASGRSWKAYMESMPKPCFVGSSGLYVQKHNPFIYFNNIRKSDVRCNKIVPSSQLATDLSLIKTTPNFIWISPNNCHNMHDCSVAEGDKWLSIGIPKILNSPVFLQQNSLLIIVWDEGENNGDNRVPMVMAGRQVKSGFISDIKHDHYSLLRTIEAAWGLPPLTESDEKAEPMKEFFN